MAICTLDILCCQITIGDADSKNPMVIKNPITLYEVQNMLKEAQEEDDKTGLSRCYNIMSQIYTIKRFDSMAFEWRLIEIELTEKYKLENYNIAQPYAQIAN